MKKLLPILFCLTILPAFAVKIAPDTQLKWNANVIVAAADNTGLRNLSAGLVYNKILFNLLQRETFSLEEAYDVCFDEFYKLDIDDVLDYRKACSDFKIALFNENNRMTFGVNVYNQTKKVYTKDKLYYAMETNIVYDIRADKGCKYAVFESATDKIVATCEVSVAYPSHLKPNLVEAGWTFKSITSDDYQFFLRCGYGAPSNTYGECYKLTYYKDYTL